MINYKETFEQYKKDFERNFKDYILFHKGVDLTLSNFLNREKTKWQEIEAILLDRESENLGNLPSLTGELFEKQFELYAAISEIGSDGEEFMKYKCDSILKFLETKLNAIENSNNINNQDNLNLNISPENLIKLEKIENKFDKTPIKIIYIHYYTCLVEKKHLSEDDLIRYLDLAFDKKTPPERLFSLSNVKAKKMKIRSYFYIHYTEIAGAPNGKQLKYASLLADYFEGFASKSFSTNFNK
jgi:hypothetical protein